jgi:hypothetical protein
MSEQVVPSTTVKGIIVKLLPTENMKPAEIQKRLRAQFSDEMLCRTQVYDWNKSFKEGWTDVENI